ncbi:MAG: hypothetical protein HC811_03700 [Flammeovirgaceae bacterium]|nr:hypothetical protein [Flammeovirgaceae bacterium]
MKTKLLAFLSIVLLSLTSSCELFNQLDDVTFDIVLMHPKEVDENLTGSNVTYTDVQTLNASAHPDIDKYKDKIESFTVNRVTYTIKNFASDDGSTVNFSNGSTSFSAVGASSGSVIATVSNVDLLSAATSEDEFDLDVNAAGLEEIANYLKNDLAVKIYSSGTLSKIPVSFTVETRMYVTVVAGALN